jgi:membrane-associated phospholipid phosphatase
VAGLAGLLALVGPSRIQQGHHWTTDVVASYLLGAAYLFALVEAYRATTPRGFVQRVLHR